jgi:transposase InsO family protein
VATPTPSPLRRKVVNTREQNQLADALATLASLITLNDEEEVQIRITSHDCPAYEILDIEEESDHKPWYHDILTYVKFQEYPSHATESDKKTIRRLAMGFCLQGNILYKRTFDGLLLRCLDEKEAQRVIQEVHEGSCASHPSGHNMARKILRMGYYWLKLEKDCIDYTRRCHKCQIYADRIHLPANQLHVFAPTWPFSMWGLDMIGPINPKASNGHRFILVAIDYFTKWVEAASYSSVTQNVVTRFIKNNIICRYGLPGRIITDNGSNLNNKMMDRLCSQFKISHHNSVPYRPQMNGAVEAANKNIKKIIQKMTVTYKDWHEKLPYALFAYRITARVSTGATPYSLVYGTEAVIPIEVEIPSLRVLMETQQDEAEWVKTRYDQLNLIEEKRLAALCHSQAYQQRISRSFDKKVKDRQIQEGDLVVKQINPVVSDPRGKWSPNYEGPYVVKRIYSGGALVLAEMDNPDCQIIVNSDIVKRYYA